MSLRKLVVAGGLLSATLFSAAPALAAGTSSISGTVFQDADRDGFRDAGEAAFTGLPLYLFSSSGAYLANTTTDSAGRYSFAGIADGGYTVEVDSSAWRDLRHDWVPTGATSDLSPHVTRNVAGATTADLPLRAIVRSTDSTRPLSTYTGSEGLTVRSYDDAVSAEQVYRAALTSSLIGAEAAYTTVLFDLSSTSVTNSSTSYSGSNWVGYAATCWVTYDSWLDTGAATLVHEYGHAWSGYYVGRLNDPQFSGYLQARGLAGDSRVGTSYAWSPSEMIADDFRQLFGSSDVASGAHLNREIPAAGDVPGLRDYLTGPFRAGSASSTTTSPAPAPAPSIDVSTVSITPTPVVKSGTVKFTLSSPGRVSVTITDAQQRTVRTLANNASMPAGTSSLTWDRKDATGRRVPSGTYAVTVVATDASSTDTAAVSFSVN